VGLADAVRRAAAALTARLGGPTEPA
jgi:hypothetical protein